METFFLFLMLCGITLGQIGPPEWECCDRSIIQGTEQCFFFSYDESTFIPCANCTREGCLAWGESYTGYQVDFADPGLGDEDFFPNNTCLYSPGAQVDLNISTCVRLEQSFYFSGESVMSFSYDSDEFELYVYTDAECVDQRFSWGDYTSATGNHASEFIIFPIEDYFFIFFPPYETSADEVDSAFVLLADMPEYHPRAPLMPQELDLGECIHPYSVVGCELLGRRDVTYPVVRQYGEDIFIFSDYGTSDYHVFEGTGCGYNKTVASNVSSTWIERMGVGFWIPDTEESIINELMCSWGFLYETADGIGYFLTNLEDTGYPFSFDGPSQFTIGDWEFGLVTTCSDILDGHVLPTEEEMSTTDLEGMTTTDVGEETSGAQDTENPGSDSENSMWVISASLSVLMWTLFA